LADIWREETKEDDKSMTFLQSFFELGIPAILLLLLLSFLFKDWFGWRWLEHLIMGTAAGVVLTTTYGALNRMAFTPLINGDISMIIPIILGLLLYTRFIPQYRWLARYGFLLAIATGTGVIIGGTFQGQILPQVIDSAKIVGDTAMDTLGGILLFVGFVSTLSYFVFTREQTGILGATNRVGRLTMMVGFGLSFAWLIQTYFAVILERIYWIITKVLGL
jgi:hypothetical protein